VRSPDSRWRLHRAALGVSVGRWIGPDGTPARCREGDEQASGDAAASVDQHRLTCRDLDRLGERLLRGQCRDGSAAAAAADIAAGFLASNAAGAIAAPTFPRYAAGEDG
jgi:hypothetical protein